MKVAIDMRAWSWAGVGRYLRNVVKEMMRLDEKLRVIGIAGEKDEGEVRRYFRDEIKAGQMTIRKVDGSYYSWAEQVKLPGQLAGVEADLWHFTHFNVPLMFGRPYVVTIHDITRFIFPGQTGQGWLRQMAYELVFAKAVERARGVICVSETTRHDLNDLPINIKGEQQVIHEGVDEIFLREIDQEMRRKARMLVGSQEDYVLYVGVWMGHKNLRRSLEAFKDAAANRPRLKMAMTGRAKKGYVDVAGIVKKISLGEDKMVYLGQVADELLPALYAEAKCLLFPSLYEGFGLPVIEAMAAGCPVLTSNVSSLPEVVDGAAVLVNPERVSSIVDGLEKILSDEEYRQGLIQSGKERAKRFNWQDCARETLRIYEGVVRG